MNQETQRLKFDLEEWIASKDAFEILFYILFMVGKKLDCKHFLILLTFEV